MENKSNILLKKIKLNQKHPIREISNKKQKINHIKLINLTKRKKPEKRLTSVLANQNMNNFAHLYKHNQNSKLDILWTLNLRQSDTSLGSRYEKYIKNKELINQIKEPSFYQEDLDKYMKKKMTKSKSSNEIYLPTLNQYSHLFRSKLTETHGTTLNNKDLLNFELTLRSSNFNDKRKNENFKKDNNNDEKKEINKIKWNNSIYKDTKKELYTINYNMNTDSKKMNNNWLEEKLVMRPYKAILKKVIYDDKSNLIRKIYIKDKEKAYNKLGDNYSYKPYNDKYCEKNYNNIENLLKGNSKSQQNVWFQLSLRNNTKSNLSLKY